ncbi:MAG: hypothetical protein QOD86_59, partial [Miltoncostaeaceae bacterium]|nr:hypothetical protein [Miltoncostaeaceae bacterium]
MLAWLAALAGPAPAAWERVPGEPPSVPANSALGAGGLAFVEGVPHVLTTSFVTNGAPELRVRRWAAGEWAALGGGISSGGNIVTRAMTVVGGRPWAVWNEDREDSIFQVHVARWDGSDWVRVGGIVNHDPDQPTNDVAIGVVAGVPHVLWNERGVKLEAHVARWDGSAWVELGSSASAPDAVTRPGAIVEFGGRPYATWTDQNPGGVTGWAVRVARWTGSAWEPVGGAANPLTEPRVDEPLLVEVAGRLHAVWRQSERAWVARLEGGSWRTLAELGDAPVTAVRAAAVRGVLVVSRVESGVLRVARLRGDATGFDEVGAPLNADGTQRAGAGPVAGLDRVPWVAWAEPVAGGGSRLQLARLLPEFGEPSASASADGAVLRVPVNTFGMPMEVRFDYGRSSPDTRGPTALVTGSEPASATLTGLSSAADYVWSASSGEVSTPVARFRTAAAPTATATPSPTPAPASTPAPAATAERSGPRRSAGDRVAPDRAVPAISPPRTPAALQPSRPAPRSPTTPAPAGTPAPSSPSFPGLSQSQRQVAVTEEAPPQRRPRLAASLRRLDDLPLSAEDIARSLGIALLLAALLGLPTKLFNATWKANRLAMAAAFARWTRFVAPRRGRLLLGLAPVSMAISAIIIGFLNPGFPTAPGSGALALGAFLGIGVIVSALYLAWRAYRRRHLPGGRVAWHVYPGQISFAVTCVLVSRAAHFVPGLIMGMSGDYEVKSDLDTERRGRLIYFLMRGVAITALAAWLLSIPVGDAAAEPDAAFATLVLDVVLTVVAVAGMEYLVFSGLPLVFLDGHDLWTWSRSRWAAVWGTALLWFSLVVLNP